MGRRKRHHPGPGSTDFSQASVHVKALSVTEEKTVVPPVSARVMASVESTLGWIQRFLGPLNLLALIFSIYGLTGLIPMTRELRNRSYTTLGIPQNSDPLATIQRTIDDRVGAVRHIKLHSRTKFRGSSDIVLLIIGLENRRTIWNQLKIEMDDMDS
ncbi:hypothetical protein BS47DRAFT_1395759 [Hydnum rufescens UP504]|uniref:Uncharacterized protein n=1 Tax=Hydnum rufescens UP504 TaxID=1448309 RepID=A0A9P6DR32_9AGAM|nr:hypothetical protein BS47DRAFT_1395759 [Hydnum rufescens UP504]